VKRKKQGRKKPTWAKPNTMAIVWHDNDGTRHIEITKTKPGRWMSPEEHDEYIRQSQKKYGRKKTDKRGDKAA
jgi:hypothetical protein